MHGTPQNPGRWPALLGLSILFATAVKTVHSEPPVLLNTNSLSNLYSSEPALTHDRQPGLGSDGQGTMVAIWLHGVEPQFQRSTDAGAHWTKPAPFNIGSISLNDFYPKPAIATDGSGTWVAIWRGNPTRNFYVSRSTDNGQTWLAPQVLVASPGDVQSAPQRSELAYGNGAWVFVYDTSTAPGEIANSDADVVFLRSTDGGQSWSVPAILNAGGANDTVEDSTPDIATDGHGKWMALWQTRSTLGGTIGPDLDIVGARSTNNGQTWSAPFKVNSDAATDGDGHDYDPEIASDGAGRWMAVWGAWRNGGIGQDGDILMATSTNDGANWSNWVTLNAGALTDGTNWSNGQFYQRLAHDGHGTWMATWWTRYAQGSDGAGPRGVYSTNGGATWSAEFAVGKTYPDAPGSGEDDVNLVATGVNSFYYLWETDTLVTELTGQDRDLAASRTTQTLSSWTGPDLFNQNGYAYQLGDRHLSFDTDGSGKWVAGWESNDPLSDTLGLDEDLLFVRSTNNAASWSAIGPLNPNAAGDVLVFDREPEIEHVQGTNWLAVWSAQTGSRADIRFARSTDSGVSFAGTGSISQFNGMNLHPAVAADSAGNCIAAWDGPESAAGGTGQPSILVSRSSNAGATWATPQVLAIAPYVSYYRASNYRPTVARNASGTWIVGWSEYRSENILLHGTYGTGKIGFVRSGNNGQTWSATSYFGTQNVQYGQRHSSPAFAANANGRWLAFWRLSNLSNQGPLRNQLVYAISTNDGVSWNDPIIVDSNAGLVNTEYFDTEGIAFHERPSVVHMGGQKWAAAWTSNEHPGFGSDWDIFIIYSEDDGQSWSVPKALNPNAATDSVDELDVKLRVTPAGDLVAGWSSGNQVSVSGPSQPAKLMLMAVTPLRNSVDDWILWR